MKKTSNSDIQRAKRVFDRHIQECLTVFNSARVSGRVSGEFYASQWRCCGGVLRFNPVESAMYPKSDDILLGFPASLARCIAATTIVERLTFQAVYARLYGVRLMQGHFGSDIENWISVTGTDLDRVVFSLRKAKSASTIYARANGISFVVDYINDISIRRNGASESLLSRRIRWSHGIANPTRAWLDVTTCQHDEHSRKKFQEDLHLALGSARAMIRRDVRLEPSPGYDLIRLEALSFAMALGLRAGEIASLPINAVDVEKQTNTLFARVLAKREGFLPRAPSRRFGEMP